MAARRGQDNFQLIIITHDENFAHQIGERREGQCYYLVGVVVAAALLLACSHFHSLVAQKYAGWRSQTAHTVSFMHTCTRLLSIVLTLCLPPHSSHTLPSHNTHTTPQTNRYP